MSKCGLEKTSNPRTDFRYIVALINHEDRSITIRVILYIYVVRSLREERDKLLELRDLTFLRSKWALAAMLCWAALASFTTAYYYYLYNDLLGRLQGGSSL